MQCGIHASSTDVRIFPEIPLVVEEIGGFDQPQVGKPQLAKAQAGNELNRHSPPEQPEDRPYAPSKPRKFVGGLSNGSGEVVSRRYDPVGTAPPWDMTSVCCFSAELGAQKLLAPLAALQEGLVPKDQKFGKRDCVVPHQCAVGRRVVKRILHPKPAAFGGGHKQAFDGVLQRAVNLPELLRKVVGGEIEPAQRLEGIRSSPKHRPGKKIDGERPNAGSGGQQACGRCVSAQRLTLG